MRLTNYLLASLIMFSFNLYAQSDKDKDEKKKTKENKNLPIKPDRFFELSTNTGSWMSLDVSPDGETIVFDLLHQYKVLKQLFYIEKYFHTNIRLSKYQIYNHLKN